LTLTAGKASLTNAVSLSEWGGFTRTFVAEVTAGAAGTAAKVAGIKAGRTAATAAGNALAPSVGTVAVAFVAAVVVAVKRRRLACSLVVATTVATKGAASDASVTGDCFEKS